MTHFVTVFATGVQEAAVIALVALGFLLIHKATGAVNFAQGDLVTLGAYLSAWCIKDQNWPYAVAYVVTVGALFGVGVVLERVAYAPVRNRSPHIVVVTTLGAALMIRSLITTWQGSAPIDVPSPIKFDTWSVSGASIPYLNVATAVVAAVAVVLLAAVLHRSAFGRQVRALASDRVAAELQGIRTRRMSMLAFGFAAALAGVAGLLIAPTASITPSLGFNPMLYAFAAAILGGFGRLGAMVVGALAIALVHQFGGGYVSSRFADLYPFLVMLAVIAWRPQGLFGEEAGVRV